MMWVALLRAINLGKTNQVKMADLRELLTDELGYDDVRTLLQSGNVVFSAPEATAEQLELDLAVALEKRFGFAVPTMVRSADEWAAMIEANPFRGLDVGPKELYANFLEVQPDEALMDALEAEAHAPNEFAFGDRVMYLRLPNGIMGTTLAGIDKRLAVKSTNRNWNTVVKIQALLAG